jgi:hypothetical protein
MSTINYKHIGPNYTVPNGKRWALQPRVISILGTVPSIPTSAEELANIEVSPDLTTVNNFTGGGILETPPYVVMCKMSITGNYTCSVDDSNGAIRLITEVFASYE